MDAKNNSKRSVIIESPRDQRVHDYIVSTVGQDAVDEAIAQITGGRRTYVSNIAKILKLAIPAHVEATPPEEVREMLQGMLQMLKSKR